MPTTQTTPSRGPAAWRALALVAATVALANVLHTAWDQYWTYDEPYHLVWSQRLLEQRVDQRYAGEMYNSKTPVMLPNVVLRRVAAGAGVQDQTALRFLARLPSACWLVALFVATFVLARRLFGVAAAWLATLMAALDPSLAAHSTVATVDTAYALGTVLTVLAAVRCLPEPTVRNALALGAALGFAFAAKFTAFLLLPPLLVLPVLAPAGQRSVRRWAAAGAWAIGAAWLVITGAYLFVNVGQPLGKLGLRWPPLASVAAALPGLRLPVPGALLTGLDACLLYERGAWTNSYVLGSFHPEGAWYYFVFHWLIKTPVLLLPATAIGLALAWRAARHEPQAAVVALNLALPLAYLSFIFHAQVGYRFALMCIPLAAVLAAGGLAPLFQGPRWRLVVPIMALGSLAEGLMFFGNPLNFTNAMVWPKFTAYRLTADIAWGQDDVRVRRWLKDRGIQANLRPLHILPGRNAFTATDLVGAVHHQPLRWLKNNAQPKGGVGSYVWFDVSPELYGRFLDEERRLRPSGPGIAACHEGDGAELATGSRIAFPPAGGAGVPRWLACIAMSRPVDLGLRVSRGLLDYGPLGEDGCETSVVGAQSVAWYRLEPGRHALCLQESQGRASLSRVEAQLIVRAHPARVWLKEQTSATIGPAGPTPAR